MLKYVFQHFGFVNSEVSTGEPFCQGLGTSLRIGVVSYCDEFFLRQ